MYSSYVYIVLWIPGRVSFAKKKICEILFAGLEMGQISALDTYIHFREEHWQIVKNGQYTIEMCRNR